MVTFRPGRPGRLADVPSFDRGIGGAESNVACGLAAAGHAVRWVSRVGADGFGDHLVEAIGAYGVDVSAVRRDPARPTGVYFRTAGDRSDDAHEVAYYRAGSAASAMSVHTVDLAAARAARILHVSGITAALSEDCLGLLRELTAPAPGRPLVSFDVNHRAGLWPDTDGPRVLLELARGADIVFVGEDEAAQAWGLTGGPRAIRQALPEPGVLVVKEGARGATVFERGSGEHGTVDGGTVDGGTVDGRTVEGGVVEGESGGLGSGGLGSGDERTVGARQPLVRAARPHGTRSGTPHGTQPGAAPSRPAPGRRASGAAPVPGAGGTPPAPGPAPAPGAEPATTFVPALHVDVVAPVGAGDAFAAGFLSGTLRGLPVRDRVRHGHLMAAATLTAPGDLAPPPARHHADRLVALDDDAWGRLRLGPGWTQAEQWAEEEVRTP
ncbi:sugar kinase [Streptomyces sp. ALI-76-A]|uniref:sugar kinase n=1 Tax=Streptomyces sp. ALI-76-A TaxID=3025736 RepID=UPI00256EDC38|nr:sugar kinase [Streptomyces sp. ALI-76-A]MDL5203525.1 sugar kinase [Streptomyces sp. ALI-76-A]